MSFEQASRDFGLSDETVQAGKLLDKAMESQDLSLERTNYLSILSNVFSKVESKSSPICRIELRIY